MQTANPERQGGDRFEALLNRWGRYELWAGLVIVAIGFVAVAVGWFKAADTADVRVQMQAMISGGLGGLAFVLAGAALIHSHATTAGFRRLEHQLNRVADAVLDLAITEEHQLAGLSPRAFEPTVVLASHASYHKPDCDLAAGRKGLRELSLGQAEQEQLRPCGVCFASQGALA